MNNETKINWKECLKEMAEVGKGPVKSITADMFGSVVRLGKVEDTTWFIRRKVKEG